MPKIDHRYDGTDPDCPEQRPPESRPISWTTRQLAADYAELKAMSEAEINRYCGRSA